MGFRPPRHFRSDPAVPSSAFSTLETHTRRDSMRSRCLRGQILAVLALVAGLLSLPASARAQAVYGSIAGKVEDSTGAALPGTNVTITSVERQTSDTVVTNSSG